MKHLIAPSILAADFLNLQRDVEMVNASGADWFHVDVMDGSFVPNISFGTLIIEAVKKVATKPLDVHIMMVQPERYIETFRAAGADVITVHYEACTHLHRTLQHIRNLGAKAGVAINPATPPDVLSCIMEEVDVICVMSVNPGFGGQKFIYNTIPKIRKLKALIDEHNAPILIEVDGGIGLQNAEAVLQAGANVLVAGSSVFGSKMPLQTIQQLKTLGANLW